MMSQKVVLFIGLYVGYTLVVYCRKAFSFVWPSVLQSNELEERELGYIMSIQYFGYTLSKFYGGVIADNQKDPRSFFVTMVLLTGLCTLLFSGFSSVLMLMALASISGIAQGPTWPCSAVLLKSFCKKEQFGTMWSLMSSSMNVAGSIGPIVASVIAVSYGWRVSVGFAGLACIASAFISYLLMYSKEPVHSTPKNAVSHNKEKKHKMYLQLLKHPVFFNLCINYVILSFTREAVQSWGQVYLIKEKGRSPISGSGFVSSFEVGGMIGSLLAGFLSDQLIAKTTVAQPRLMVIACCYSNVVAFLVLFLWTVDETSTQVWLQMTGFGIGLGIYGMISLFGVTAVENAPSHLTGTADSTCSLFSNIGQLSTGMILTNIATFSSWYQAFTFLAFLCTGALFHIVWISRLPEKAK